MNFKESISHYFLEVSAFLTLFFTELSSALYAIGFLIMVDTFLGIWAAKNTGGWKSITSRKAGRIISKLIVYPLAIMVAKVAQEYLSPSIPWIDVTTGIIATVEVKSIFENSSIILGYNLWEKIKKAIWKDKEQ
jgi:hypothetical protein